MCASCQGAPCFDIAYDDPVYDLTCVCPVIVSDGPNSTVPCSVQRVESEKDGERARVSRLALAALVFAAPRLVTRRLRPPPPLPPPLSLPPPDRRPVR